MLAEIIAVFESVRLRFYVCLLICQEFMAVDCDDILRSLSAFAQTNRFALVLDFLTKDEKAKVWSDRPELID